MKSKYDIQGTFLMSHVQLWPLFLQQKNQSLSGSHGVRYHTAPIIWLFHQQASGLN